MSLRGFHIVFVSFTILLLFYLCYWNYNNWISIGYSSSIIFSFLSFFCAVFVAFYGYKFYDKTKEINV